MAGRGFVLWNPSFPPSVPFQVAAWDTTIEDVDPEWSGYRTWGQAGFDLGTGKIRLQIASTLFASNIEFWIADTFVVGGVPSGTPVEVVAELRTHGSLVYWLTTHSAAVFEASLYSGTAGDSMSADGRFEVPALFDQTLRVPIHARAGEPFEVRTYMIGGSRILGYGECIADAEWSFHVDTPGATLTSCYGYAGAPTAVQPATWGGIKARYR